MDEVRATRRAPWRTFAPWVWPVLAVHAATSVLRIGAIAWKGGGVVDELLAWDAEWYMHIAEHGYAPRPGFAESTFGFFPVFPGLIEVVHVLSPLDYRWSALLAAQLAALAASLAVYALVRDLTDAPTALWFVALFNLQPMAISLSMAYTEGLFVALAAGALLALRRQDWLLGGALASLAGLTRITGLAVGVAFVVAAVTALARRRTPRWQIALGTAMACAGAPLYVLWVGRRQGSLLAYRRLQEEGWSAEWDWGHSTATFVEDALRSGEDWLPVSVAFIVLAVVVGSLVGMRSIRWAPLWAYGLGVLALSFGQSNSFQGRPRYVVPALLFLLPVAVGLARARRGPALGTLALYGTFGAFFGAYMLVTWDFAV